MRYYQWYFDTENLGWKLSYPNIEPRQPWAASYFAMGLPRTVEGDLKVPVSAWGEYPLDFELELGGAPVVNQKILDLILELNPEACQVFPVDIENYAPQGYFLLNITQVAEDCLDLEAATHIHYGTDHLTGEKRITTIWHCQLLPEKIPAHFHLFRIKEWILPVIISETFKDKLESRGFTGMTFQALFPHPTQFPFDRTHV